MDCETESVQGILKKGGFRKIKIKLLMVITVEKTMYIHSPIDLMIFDGILILSSNKSGQSIQRHESTQVQIN